LVTVFGVRGGKTKEQAPTVALGWRDNWNILFVAIQGGAVSSELRIALGVACSKFRDVPHVVDARSMAGGDRNWMSSGISTASAHAEMLVLAAMLKYRADRPAVKLSTATRRTDIIPGVVQKVRILGNTDEFEPAACEAAC